MAALNSWQIGCSSVRCRTNYILENKLWTDCDFVIGTDENMKTFSGHKLILSMASAVFEDMFFGKNYQNGKPIIISDLKAETFEDMLHFIYTDKWNVTTFERACSLCYAAIKYILPDLKSSCITYLQKELSPSNVCQGYEFAYSIEATTLKKQCLDMIRSQTKEILADPNFFRIAEGTFLTILDQDVLEIDSELELYQALIKYIEMKEASNQSTEDTSKNSLVISISSNESNPNISANCTNPTGAQFIERALRKVRFLTMDAMQFCKEVTNNYIDESDAFKILVNICNPSTDIPIPEGFCTLTKPRKAPPTLERTFSEPSMSPSVRRKSLSGIPKGARTTRCATTTFRRSSLLIGVPTIKYRK